MESGYTLLQKHEQTTMGPHSRKSCGLLLGAEMVMTNLPSVINRDSWAAPPETNSTRSGLDPKSAFKNHA